MGLYPRKGVSDLARMTPQAVLDKYDILLIDEVLAVGDAAFQKKCLGEIGQAAGHVIAGSAEGTLYLLDAGAPGLSCLRYVNAPEPSLPNGRWLRLGTRLGGICGSDLSELLLHTDLKVPVGLMCAAWGAAPIQPWTAPGSADLVPAIARKGAEKQCGRSGHVWGGHGGPALVPETLSGGESGGTGAVGVIVGAASGQGASRGDDIRLETGMVFIQ